MKNPKRYELSFNPDKLGEQWDNPCKDLLQGLENTEVKPEAESNSHLAEFSIGKCFEAFWSISMGSVFDHLLAIEVLRLQRS